MSKSKGNYIGIGDSLKDMFGKTMSIGDELMWKWYTLLFNKTPAEIADLKKNHPMEAKKALAHAIVAQYHAPQLRITRAKILRNNFRRKTVRNRRESECVRGEILIVELRKRPKFKSRGDIRCIIQQGGVTLDAARRSPMTRPRSMFATVKSKPQAGRRQADGCLTRFFPVHSSLDRRSSA